MCSMKDLPRVSHTPLIGCETDLVDSWQLHICRVIGDVHEGGVDHLVVDGVLSGGPHAAGTSIQVIDKQGAHFSLQRRSFNSSVLI